MKEQQTIDEFSQNKKQAPVPVARFFFFSLIIIIASWVVYDINVNTLQHARNLTRTLHYHVLNHQIIGVYWFGQEMLNYPTHQYYLLQDFQFFLENMRVQMGHLEDISYGMVDQTTLNATKQQILVSYRNGSMERYGWSLEEGPQEGVPFDFQNISKIKQTFISCHYVDINFQPIDLGNHNVWDITVHIEPFSVTSIFVTLFMSQHISLANHHILPFTFGLLLAALLAWQKMTRNAKLASSFLQYFLCFFLLMTSILAFSQNYPFEFVFILDGLTALSAWLCAIKFYTKEADYKLSFLLNQSYGMIGRLFASFGPLLIAFSMFGYCVFSRYSGQFSSFWRTFTSLFYICYYNMTYESSVVTGRSNPISMIFFITFVLLFTICIYSGMLVSVFCSYVWGKREEQIKRDIVANLKIQCSSCDHKYRYSDRSKVKPKISFNLSQFLDINWKNPDECMKYKRVMGSRIKRLREQCQKYTEEMGRETRQNQVGREARHIIIQDLWRKKRYISNLIGQHQ